jgi:ABC-type amino acid transport substrate-binding protein
MSENSTMAKRTIRVGIDDAPPAPMQFGNPDNGDFRGYEVDLLEEIARRV